jgi:hypothetical protein
MTPEQIVELVQIAQRDCVLWANLKDREINQFNEDGSAKIPSLAMLVEEFVKQKYGPTHIYARISRKPLRGECRVIPV